MTKAVDIKFNVNNNWETLLDVIYPVGSVYIAYTSTSPADRFGGSWTQMTDKVLRMANNVNTGGADSITLVEKNIPHHTHTFTGSAVTSGNASQGHTHTISNHVHTLNEHTHGVGSYKAASAGAHEHDVFWTGAAKPAEQTISMWPTNAADGNLWWLASYSTKKGTLYAVENGAHTHTISGTSGKASGNTGNPTSNPASGGQSQSHTHSVTAKGTNSAYGGQLKSGSTTEYETVAFSNIPKYQNVYAWRRTA